MRKAFIPICIVLLSSARVSAQQAPFQYSGYEQDIDTIARGYEDLKQEFSRQQESYAILSRQRETEQAALREQLSALELQVKSCDLQIEKLQEENAVLSAALQEKDSRLTKESTDQRSEAKSLTLRLNEQTRENRRLKEELQQARLHKETLPKQPDDELCGLRAQLEKFKERQRLWQGQLNDLKNTMLAEFSGSLQEKDELIITLRNDRTKSTDDLRRAQSACALIENQKKTLEDELAGFKSRLAMIVEQKDEQNKTFGSLQGEMIKLRLEINQHQDLLQKREQEIAGLKASLEAQEQKAAEGVRKAGVLESELATERQKLSLKNQECQYLQKSMEEAGVRLEGSEKERGLSEKRLDALKAAGVEAAAALEAQKEENQTLKKRISDLQGESEALSAGVSEKEVQLRRLAKSYSEASEKLAQLERLLQQALARNAFLEADKLKLQEDNRRFAQDGARSASLIGQQQSRIQEFELSLQSREKEINSLQGSSNGLKQEIAQCQERIHYFEDSVAGLNALLAEKEKTIKELSGSFQRQLLDTPVPAQPVPSVTAGPPVPSTAVDPALSTHQKVAQQLRDELQNYRDLLEKMKVKNDQLTHLRQKSEEEKEQLQQSHKELRSRLSVYARKVAQSATLKERLMKENAVLHYNLGVFYLQRNEHQEAATEFRKALELNPDDAASHYNLGLIYAEYLDNKPKAISHFKRYLQLDPKDKDADRARKYILTWEMWNEGD